MDAVHRHAKMTLDLFTLARCSALALTRYCFDEAWDSLQSGHTQRASRAEIIARSLPVLLGA